MILISHEPHSIRREGAHLPREIRKTAKLWVSEILAQNAKVIARTPFDTEGGGAEGTYLPREI